MPRLKNKKTKKPAIHKSISAMICSELGGEPLPHYEMVQQRPNGKPGHQYILAQAGDLICPRIHIPASFDWKGNNALRLELFYNAKDREPLVGLPIPRRPHDEAIYIDVDKWPIWHAGSRTWRDAKFAFRELRKHEDGKQSEYTRGGHDFVKEPLGQIRIALTRMRILEYHEGMKLPDLGDQEGLRTMERTPDPVLLRSVDLNIGISSLEETLLEGRMPYKFKMGSINDGHRINLRFYFRQKDKIDNPIDYYRASVYHKTRLRVELEAVTEENRIALGTPVSFSDYFQEATSVDPLKLFPTKERPSADALAQEQVLQENMGDRDTHPGSMDPARSSDGTVAFPGRFFNRIGTRETVGPPNEIGDVQSESSDEDVEHLYTTPVFSSSPNFIFKSEEDQRRTPTVRDVLVSSSRSLKRAATIDSNDGAQLAKVQKLVDEEAEIERQLELLQDEGSDFGEAKLKHEDGMSSPSGGIGIEDETPGDGQDAGNIKFEAADTTQNTRSFLWDNGVGADLFGDIDQPVIID
ncbi:hypothetical protein MMC18_008808 [Xylographa bjoerkii]|nr:hypothetical protein [Xylographa bjoerkii]